MEPIRVLVVDDHSLVRAGFRSILSGEDDIDVVGEAKDGAEAVAAAARELPDVVLMDIRMPGMDGLTLIRQARRFRPDLPVLVITGFSSETAAIEALNLGVTGYLTKPFRVPQVLASAAKALGVTVA